MFFSLALWRLKRGIIVNTKAPLRLPTMRSTQENSQRKQQNGLRTIYHRVVNSHVRGVKIDFTLASLCLLKVGQRQKKFKNTNYSMKKHVLSQLLVVLVCTQGCTTWQLTRSTLAEGKTFTDIQYSMVLDNVAMFEDSAGNSALPWHLTFSSGDVTIKDTLNAGNPSLSYAWNPVSRVFGASASRSWQENWTAAPVTDQPTLNRLIKIYAILSDRRKTSWINNGWGKPGEEAASGWYGEIRVWVSKGDLHYLTDETLNILAAASSTGMAAPMQGPRPLLLPGPTFNIR